MCIIIQIIKKIQANLSKKISVTFILYEDTIGTYFFRVSHDTSCSFFTKTRLMKISNFINTVQTVFEILMSKNRHFYH